MMVCTRYFESNEIQQHVFIGILARIIALYFLRYSCRYFAIVSIMHTASSHVISEISHETFDYTVVLNINGVYCVVCDGGGCKQSQSIPNLISLETRDGNQKDVKQRRFMK